MRRYPRAVLLLACLAWTPPASAQEVAAVLSSESKPYEEALAGLNEALGRAVPFSVLSDGRPSISPKARVVVAFGSKAALQSYPEGVALVVAMAPGLDLNALEEGGYQEIAMVPPARALIENLKLIHPSLRRLGVVSQSPQYQRYAEDLRKAAARLGVEVVSKTVGENLELPDALRGLYRKVDALWLPPDPLLLNNASFATFKEFAESNVIPLYAPSAGLAENGATASVAPSFREVGRAAAKAAQEALGGREPRGTVYPERLEIVINRSAAGRTGPAFSQEALQKASKVLP